ncbi:hypothetical protein LCGC14_1379380 [marine sediment metagenome]|uniref:Uncharacterized protein n=1 Tax=marine sediment metagenome TaxID=412755 RepID=A0A0F9N4T4_9ZZZZ
MNGLAIAREVADEMDIKASDEYLGWLMWNETGWPAFFRGDPETVYRAQIRAALTPGDD